VGVGRSYKGSEQIMAKVIINGTEYDANYPSRRFAAFTEHGCQIDRDGNVRVASLAGLSIRTTGRVTVDATAEPKPPVFGGGRNPNDVVGEIYDSIDRAGNGE